MPKKSTITPEPHPLLRDSTIPEFYERHHWSRSFFSPRRCRKLVWTPKRLLGVKIVANSTLMFGINPLVLRNFCF